MSKTTVITESGSVYTIVDDTITGGNIPAGESAQLLNDLMGMPIKLGERLFGSLPNRMMIRTSCIITIIIEEAGQ